MFQQMRLRFWRFFGYVRMAFGVVPKNWRGSHRFFMVLHYLAVVTIFIILCYFSKQIISKEPDVTNDYIRLRDWWCGYVALLLYLTIRLVLFLVSLLRASQDSEFPDIDAAWAEIHDSLERNGIDYVRVPVFLVTGANDSLEKQLAESLNDWQVLTPPLDQRSPIRCFANTTGIFFFCSDISASSMQANISRRGPSHLTMEDDALAPSGPSSGRNVGGQTIGLEQIRESGVNRPQAAAAMTDEADAGQPRLSLSEIANMIKQTLDPRLLFGSARQKKSSSAEFRLLTKAELFAKHAQLQYFVQLLHLRRTFCPWNGVLQFAPFSWLDLKAQHRGLADAVNTDWSAMTADIKWQCPVVMAFYGLEKINAFDRFIRRFRAEVEQVQVQRAGSGFPAGAAFDAKASSFLSHRCVTGIRTLVYDIFASGLNDAGNGRVYLFFCEFCDRLAHLGSFLSELLQPREQRAHFLRFDGCYFAATGDSVDDQAFTVGILPKLIHDQHDVGYAPDVLNQNQKSKKTAHVIFVLATCILIASAILSWKIMSGLSHEEDFALMKLILHPEHRI